ncbi:MAG: hypothetical protein AAGU11_06255 [Syntrophobacteraceae bacterium]
MNKEEWGIVEKRLKTHLLKNNKQMTLLKEERDTLERRSNAG